MSDVESAQLLQKKEEQASSCCSLKNILCTLCGVGVAAKVVVVFVVCYLTSGHELRSKLPEYVDIDLCNESACPMPFWDAEFDTIYVRHDEVENELSYAKAGSKIPDFFHGIWWLDQSGSKLPPDYPFNMGASAEVLVTWGDDAVWQEDTLCVTPVPTFGSTLGHWTYYASEEGQTQLNEFTDMRQTYHFCFTNESLQEAVIYQQINVDSSKIMKAVKLLGGIETWNGSCILPPQFMQFKITQEPWGLSRQSNIFSNRLRTDDPNRKILLDYIIPDGVRDYVNTAQHYPVWQIVDGHGKRTENYEAYLKTVTSPNGTSSNTTHQMFRRLKRGYKAATQQAATGDKV